MDIPKIEKEEMRAIRREIINVYLHKGFKSASEIKKQVRIDEKNHFGQELKSYQ